MLIRGQLVLNINLKQPLEIQSAVNLLLTIQQESLPVYNEEAIKKIKEQLAAGTWVTSDKIVFPQTIAEKEELLKKADPKLYKKYYNETYSTTQAQKERESIYKHNDVHIDKNTGEISVTPKRITDYTGVKKEVARIQVTRQKQRTAALKRKRDDHGHFLPGKIKK